MFFEIGNGVHYYDLFGSDRQRAGDEEKDPQFWKGRCYACGKKGHTQKFCSEVTGMLFCTYCTFRDHYAVQCSRRIKANDELYRQGYITQKVLDWDTGALKLDLPPGFRPVPPGKPNRLDYRALITGQPYVDDHIETTGACGSVANRGQGCGSVSAPSQQPVKSTGATPKCRPPTALLGYATTALVNEAAQIASNRAKGQITAGDLKKALEQMEAQQSEPPAYIRVQSEPSLAEGHRSPTAASVALSTSSESSVDVEGLFDSPPRRAQNKHTDQATEAGASGGSIRQLIDSIDRLERAVRGLSAIGRGQKLSGSSNDGRRPG